MHDSRLPLIYYNEGDKTKRIAGLGVNSTSDERQLLVAQAQMGAPLSGGQRLAMVTNAVDRRTLTHFSYPKKDFFSSKAFVQVGDHISGVSSKPFSLEAVGTKGKLDGLQCDRRWLNKGIRTHARTKGGKDSFFPQLVAEFHQGQDAYYRTKFVYFQARFYLVNNTDFTLEYYQVWPSLSFLSLSLCLSVCLSPLSLCLPSSSLLALLN